jgi:hypothetical protein
VHADNDSVSHKATNRVLVMAVIFHKTR